MARVRLLLVSIMIVGTWRSAPALAQQTDAADSGAAVQTSSANAGSASSASTQAASEAPSAPVAAPLAAPAESPSPAAAPAPASERSAAPSAAIQRAAPVAPSSVQPRDPLDAVRFVESEGRNVTLFERKGDQWLQVCTSPCYFTASKGPRDYAAPTKVGPATAGYRVAAKGLWLVNGDGLQADFQDRSQIRRAGVGVLIAGLVTLAFLAPALDADNRTAAKAGVLTTSGVLTVSGLVMLLMKDRMRLTRCAGCNTESAGPAAP